MIKEIFHDSFDKCKICKGLSPENNMQMLLTLIGGRLNY